MSEAGIRLEGLDEVLRRVRNLSQLRRFVARIAMATHYLAGRGAEYPPTKRLTRKEVYGTSFKTAKQRAWFFANLREGTIDVPYKRGLSPGSQSFGRRWTVETYNSGFTGVAGNNADYNQYLKDRDQQSRYHKAVGWVPIQDMVEDEQQKVEAFLFDALLEDVDGQ